MIDNLFEYIVTWLGVHLPRGHKFLPRHKAITTLFVYATRREQDGDPRLLTAFLKAANAFPQKSRWICNHIGTAILGLLEKESSDLQKRAAILAASFMSRYWEGLENKDKFINAWLSAMDHVGRMDGVAEAAIRMSFNMAWSDKWRPHMTREMWSLLKKRHQAWPLSWKGNPLIHGNTRIIPAVRSLGDAEILTSFLILTWSGLDVVPSEMTGQMCAALWEEYGIGKDIYRGELLRCLDRVLEHLNGMQCGLTPTDKPWCPGNDATALIPEEFVHSSRLAAYMRLRKELLDVERAAVVASTSRWSKTCPGLLY